MEDEEYQSLASYFEKGSLPNFRTRVYKHLFLNHAASFQLVDGILYHKSKKENKLCRVLKSSEIEEVIKNCHIEPTGAHQGIGRTYEIIRSRYYCPSLISSVQTFIANCLSCQKQNPIHKVLSELHPIPVPLTPFKLVGIDLVGPLPRRPSGNAYIAVLIDYLTKCVEAKSIPNKNAESMRIFARSNFSIWSSRKHHKWSRSGILQCPEWSIMQATQH